MRRILIPTDFSENAMNAIRHALEIFKYERSEYFIVHAFADEVYEQNSVMSRALFDELKEKACEKSDEALEKVLEEIRTISPNPRHTYEKRSVFGSLVDVANELADKLDIDLIVMGTKGHTDDRDITFGSNTLQVLKYVKCPVMAVPKDFDPIPPEKVLFPTDYQLPYKRRELKLLSTLAKSFVASVDFLHISDFDEMSFRQEDNRSFLASCFKDNETGFHRKAGGDLMDAINTFLKEGEYDMLVMVNSRHSYLENILYTSTIEKIGLEVQVPFLVLQNLPR